MSMEMGSQGRAPPTAGLSTLKLNQACLEAHLKVGTSLGASQVERWSGFSGSFYWLLLLERYYFSPLFSWIYCTLLSFLFLHLQLWPPHALQSSFLLLLLLFLMVLGIEPGASRLLSTGSIPLEPGPQSSKLSHEASGDSKDTPVPEPPLLQNLP